MANDRKRRSGEGSRINTTRLLSHVILIIVTLLTLYPVIWVLKMAFSPVQGFSTSLNPIPSEVSLENFTYLFNETYFLRWGLNSLIVAVATTLVGIFFSCTAAYAFSRFRFPGRREMLLGFLVTQMFPGVMMMIPLYLLISSLGLLDSLTGLVLVYSTTSLPFSTWMLKGYFDTIPKDLEESAIMDGATRGMIFWKIIIPLARPAIAVVALFSFMSAWNEFILAATFMNQESMYTLPVGLKMMVGQYSTEWGHFSAASLLVSFPIVALFFYLQKHLVSGLMAGGVKG